MFIYDLTSLVNSKDLAFDDSGGGRMRRQVRLTGTSPSPLSAPPLIAPHRSFTRGLLTPLLPATATDTATRTSALGGRGR